MSQAVLETVYIAEMDEYGEISRYRAISRLSRDVSSYSNWHIHVTWMEMSHVY